MVVNSINKTNPRPSSQQQLGSPAFNRFYLTGSSPTLFYNNNRSQDEILPENQQEVTVQVVGDNPSSDNWAFSRRRPRSLSQTPTTNDESTPERLLLSRQYYSEFDDPSFSYSYENEPFAFGEGHGEYYLEENSTEKDKMSGGIETQRMYAANKSKSGSLPGHYTGTTTSTNIGAYNRFLGQERLDSGYSGGSSPYYYEQQQRPTPPIIPGSSLSNNSSNLIQSQQQNNSSQQLVQPSLPSPAGAMSTSTSTPEPPRERDKESNKKWNPFGGLFRRKDKHDKLNKNQISHPILNYEATLENPSYQQQPAFPIRIQFEPSQRPVSPTKSKHVVVSSEGHNSSDAQSSDSDHKQNFITRRLSKKKKKKSSSSGKLSGGGGDIVRPSTAAAEFLKVPHSKRNVNNRYSQPNLQSWETTKRFPSSTTKVATSSSNLMLNNSNNNNNYSSSGSLSLSIEGSSSLSKSSKAAAKEATKARAVARRNSYFNDNTSSEEDEGSFQGSHTSLSRAKKGASHVINGNNNNKRPTSLISSSTQQRYPIQQQQQQQLNGISTLGLPSSPNSNNKFTPVSPRWEARVVYTKETHEDDKPVVLKLPKYSSTNAANNETNNNNYSLKTETVLSPDDEAEEQVIVTAGLKVPLVRGNDHDPIYANLPGRPPKNTGVIDHYSPSPTPPAIPVRSTPPNFYRSASGSNLDSRSYPQAMVQYEQEPSRRNGHHHYPTESPQIVDYSAGQQYYNYYGQPRTRTPTMTIGYQQQLSPVNNGEKHPSPITALATASSPVHTNASAFWKQKEQETLQQRRSTPTRGVSPLPIGTSQSPHQQLKRIRSADSSPLLIQKHFNQTPSSATARAQLFGGINSTESISSLSSFTNETGSPSPKMVSKHSQQQSKTPVSTGKMLFQQQQNKHSNDANKENRRSGTNLGSSSSRDKLGKIGQSSPINPPQPPNRQDPNNHNGHNNSSSSNRSSIKSPGKNLEDALNELEDMYKSLRLSDEDLLDRAERRDLPTPHQELKNKEFGYFNFDNFNNSIMSSPIYSPSPPPFSASSYSHHHPHFGQIGSLESLTTSGSENSRRQHQQFRVRAPPMRRSAHPDKVNDDMAKRKYDNSTKETTKNYDPKEQISQSGSYLILSPVFSPSSSPVPPEIFNYNTTKDPDLTMDDVNVINFKRANAIRVIPEPQPKFGIPLGPITAAANSDYLHATPVERFRPLYRHVKNPDLVKDDIAFRNLRKDLNQEQNNLNKDWTPKLFTPLRNFENAFNYTNDELLLLEAEKKKRLRAARSLSANIYSPVSNSSPTPFSPPPLNSYAAASQEFGNENVNIVNNNNNGTTAAGLALGRDARSLTPSSTSIIVGAGRNPLQSPHRVTNFMEPSWVQQIDLDDDELKELKRSLSPSKLQPILMSKHINPKRDYSPDKTLVTRSSSSPSSYSSVTIADYDPSKPRRPWTDIILDSFEKERQAELERQQQLAAEEEEERRRFRQSGEYYYELDEDDNEEEFVDALSQIPSQATSPIKAYLEGESQQNYTATRPESNFPLLHGQKTRRGSWVAGEPAGRTDTAKLYLDTNNDNNSHELLMKRKSWSDFPYNNQQQQNNETPGFSSKKLQFNPIATPRRVKQINLEGFHSSSSSRNNNENVHDDDYKTTSHRIAQQLDPKITSSSSYYTQPTDDEKHALSETNPNPIQMKRTTKGEQELEDLIDALVKEADTCGNTTTTTSLPSETMVHGTEPSAKPSVTASGFDPTTGQTESDLNQLSEERKRRRKFEIKARYPIDDDDDFNFGKHRRASFTSQHSTESLPPCSSEMTTTEGEISFDDNKSTNPMASLIDTISHKLVPSLEESIKKSELRMSTKDLTLDFEPEETSALAKSNEAGQQQQKQKPIPLPRQSPSSEPPKSQNKDSADQVDLQPNPKPKKEGSNKSSNQFKGEPSSNSNNSSTSKDLSSCSSTMNTRNQLIRHWTDVLMIACYVLAFTQAIAQLDAIPLVFGIVLAAFVFIASLF